ncbi:MAG TPA: 2-hydroxyacid dehydrogenase [Paraburkholderia sp.]|jgi:lactate dehydrogenase-like 2-hydroxyacid dehydrogenase
MSDSSYSSSTGPVLCIGDFPAAPYALLADTFELVSRADLGANPALAARVRAIVLRSAFVVPTALLDMLPALEIVAFCGVGYDGIDLANATARGIVVTNTPGVLDAAVAELTIGLVLSALRRLPQADRFTRDGRWRDGAFPLATSLAGKRAGIVGLGRIGHAIVRRLVPFEVECAYQGPRDQHNAIRYYADVVELARDVDLLIVCCPANAQTKHLIDARVLDALGPHGTLVNVARGSVVDEAALVAALRDGRIGAAALDVYANEPLDAASPLVGFDNVVLTPHIASATHETRMRMIELTRDNLQCLFSTGRAITPVSLPAPLSGA